MNGKQLEIDLIHKKFPKKIFENISKLEWKESLWKTKLGTFVT